MISNTCGYLNKRKPAEAGSEFLLRGMSYPRKPFLGRQCVNFIVCIYRFCFYDRVPPILRVLLSRAVHSVTLCPVETMAGPSKENSNPFTVASITGCAAGCILPNFLLVDLAGVEPASRTLFSLLHTAITYSIYLFGSLVNLGIE